MPVDGPISERDRCCWLDRDGERCPKRARYWIGTNGVDCWTQSCAEHLEALRRPGDFVHEEA